MFTKKSASARSISVFLILIFLFSLFAFPSYSYAATEAKTTNTRLSGADRYATSIAVADAYKKQSGGFTNVIVASGSNFPDALSGGYLSKVKKAPLILVNKNKESNITDYIKKNFNKNGTVYILGGETAVSKAFEKSLKEEGYKTKRLSGSKRYQTNLAVLKECGMGTSALLIASGKSFPDSLSGSAAGYPMLLVGDSLTSTQSQFIKDSKIKKFYILGGSSAVNKTVESSLKKLGTVERIGGKNRWETSYLVAQKFNAKASTVTIANGNSFPDGLSGAPIAMLNSSPIILVNKSNWSYAHQYVVDRNIKKQIIIGGTKAVENTTAKNIMSQYNSSDNNGVKWIVPPSTLYSDINEVSISYAPLVSTNYDYRDEYGSAVPNQIGYPQQWYKALIQDSNQKVTGSYTYNAGVVAVAKSNAGTKKWGIINYYGKELLKPIESSWRQGITSKFLTLQGIGYTKEENSYVKGYVLSSDYSGVRFSGWLPTGIGLPFVNYYFVNDSLYRYDGRINRRQYSKVSIPKELYDQLVTIQSKLDSYDSAYMGIGYKYIDTKGNTISQDGYYLKNFVNGYYVAISNSNKQGKYDSELGEVVYSNPKCLIKASTGKRITSCIYDDILYFEEGLCPVKKNGKWGYVNEQGKEVTEFIFDKASSLYKGKIVVMINGKFAIIDLVETLKNGYLTKNRIQNAM